MNGCSLSKAQGLGPTLLTLLMVRLPASLTLMNCMGDCFFARVEGVVEVVLHVVGCLVHTIIQFFEG